MDTTRTGASPARPAPPVRPAAPDDCDYCGFQAPTWVRPTLPLPVPGVAADDDPNWASCERCTALVKAGAWGELASVAVRTWEAGRHRRAPAATHGQLVRLYGVAAANACGPLRRIRGQLKAV